MVRKILSYEYDVNFMFNWFKGEEIVTLLVLNWLHRFRKDIHFFNEICLINSFALINFKYIVLVRLVYYLSFRPISKPIIVEKDSLYTMISPFFVI